MHFNCQSFKLSVAAALLLVGFGVARSQTAPLRGKVVMAQADGTTAPVVGAIIDVFRTDISGKWQTKTDKGGSFVFAGLPLGGTYIVAVSAPNARPEATGGIKLGPLPDGELPQPVTLIAGDGKRLTEAEAKEAAKGGGRSDASNKGESAADKAKREELIAKNKEIETSNKKIQESNKVVADSFKAGNVALAAGTDADKANKHEEAIKLYGDAVQQY